MAAGLGDPRIFSAGRDGGGERWICGPRELFGPRAPMRTTNLSASALGFGLWLAGPWLCPARAQAALELTRLAMAAPLRAAVAVAHSGGGLAASSPAYRLRLQLGGPLAPRASSASYRLEPLALGPSGALPPGPPILLALAPGGAPAPSGQAIEVRGLRLTAPGQPLSQLRFGSQPVPALPSSALLASATAPAGVGPAGNPLGVLPVEPWTNAGGALGRAPYRHLPALSQTSPAQVGQALTLGLAAEPGSFGVLALGQTLPGLVLPLPGYLGAFELTAGFTQLGPLAPLGAGQHHYLFQLPGNPQLAGQTLRLQGLVLTGLGGSFTNVLSVPIQP
jgi:hypothetical protein